MTAAGTTERRNGRRAPWRRAGHGHEEVDLPGGYLDDADPDPDERPPPPAPAVDVNAADTGRTPARMLPVAPDWGDLWQRARVAVNRAGHAGLHEGMAIRWIGWAARGAWVAARQLGAYAFDTDALAAMRSAKKDKDKKGQAWWRQQHSKTKKTRGAWAGGALVGAGVLALLIAGPGVPLGWRVLAGVPTLAVLAWIGRPGGSQDPGTSGTKTQVQVRDPGRDLVSSDQVVTAFEPLVGPGTRTVGGMHRRRDPDRWEGLVSLPGSTPASKVLGQAEAIASAFEVPSERVHLQRDGHAGQVLLVILDQDPAAGPLPPHPGLRVLDGPGPGTRDPGRLWVPRGAKTRGTRGPDLWNDGVLVGRDPLGGEVRGPLIDSPYWVVAGQQGTGKTFEIFGILVEVLLAGLWDLDVWSFKDSNDYGPLAPLCGTFEYGTSDRVYAAFLQYLKKDIKDLAAERGRVLDGLTVEENPWGKVTRELAEIYRQLRPRVVVMDEVQSALESKLGAKILAELIGGARVLRNQQIVGIMGMQYVDADTIEQLQRLIGPRICLSVARWEDSKGALAGAHDPKLGVDASKIPLANKGTAWAAGMSSTPGGAATLMRTHAVDRRALNALVRREITAGRPTPGRPATPAPAGDEAARSELAGAFRPGDGAVTCTELGVRLGLGQASVAAKKAAELARRAGIEPRRDTTGKATGQREALYVHSDQLTERQ